MAAFYNINIISVLRLRTAFCSARLLPYTGDLLLISLRPSCCFFSSLESYFQGPILTSYGMDRPVSPTPAFVVSHQQRNSMCFLVFSLIISEYLVSGVESHIYTLKISVTSTWMTSTVRRICGVIGVVAPQFGLF